MPRTVDDYSIALEQTPECARRIGIILGLFAMVEFRLVETVRWIADTHRDLALVSLGSHKGFAAKIEYVAAICRWTQPDWPRDSEAGATFVRALRIANSIRNKYAHSRYSKAGSEMLRLEVANQMGKADSVERADIQALDEDILFLKHLIVAMINYCEARGRGQESDLSELRQAIDDAHPNRPV